MKDNKNIQLSRCYADIQLFRGMISEMYPVRMLYSVVHQQDDHMIINYNVSGGIYHAKIFC